MPAPKKPATKATPKKTSKRAPREGGESGYYVRTLGPTHLAACRMRVEGKSNDQISAELGIAKGTLYRWFSDPKMKAEIERLMARVDDMFAEKMAAAGMTGIEALVHYIGKSSADNDQVSESQRLDAIKTLLDRIPQTSLVRDRSAEKPDQLVALMQFFQSADDKQLLTAAQRLLPEGIVDGDVVP